MQSSSAIRRGRRVVATFVTIVVALGVLASSAWSTTNSPVKIKNLSDLEAAVTSAQSLTVFPSSQMGRLIHGIGLASYQGACQSVQTDSAQVNKHCWFGSATSNEIVVLFGDSEAGMWLPTFIALARLEHFKLFAAARKACPLAALPAYPTYAGECATWKSNAIKYINSLHPRIVVMDEKDVGYNVDPRTPSAATPIFSAGLRSALEAVHAPTKIMLSAMPYYNPANRMPIDPATCIKKVLTDKLPLTVCDTPVSRAFVLSRLKADNSAAALAGVHIVSVEPLFCAQVNCPVAINGQLAWSNRFHTPVWYATMVTDAMESLLKPFGL